MHAISSYRGNRPTNKHTHKQTGPITIQCAAKHSAQCNNYGMVPSICLFVRSIRPTYGGFFGLCDCGIFLT